MSVLKIKDPTTGEWMSIQGDSHVPEPTTEDDGKIIVVADGAYKLEAVPEFATRDYVQSYVEEYISSALEGDY